MITVNDIIKINPKHIYLDVDETLIDSIDAVLLQLNRRYGTDYKSNQVNTWNFTNLFPNITSIEIEEIFDSEEFFETVKWKDGAIDFVKRFHDKITIVTCGNATNLYLKEKFIRNIFPNIDFIGLESTVMDKSSVPMGQGDMMIDDNQDNLYSVDAEYKILFENIPNADWNNTWYENQNFWLRRQTCGYIITSYYIKNYKMKAWI